MNIDLSVKIGNILMKNPLTTASGTFGQGDVFKAFYDINILGAITTKSVTINLREGNPPPRIAETTSGYLNSIGLQNPGIELFIKKYKTYFKELQTNIIVSIAGNTVEEYALLAERITKELDVQGIEINISCPNVKEKGLQFASNYEAAYKVVKAVKNVTNLTIITKLTPNTENNVDVALSCIEAGSDAIAIMNTLKGMAIDLEKRRPLLANIIGGFSGPAIKPVALRWVYELANKISKPIIAMGGISSAEDALEFIVCGATAISIGTANFFNPQVIPEIISGMQHWLHQHKINNIQELKNTLKK